MRVHNNQPLFEILEKMRQERMNAAKTEKKHPLTRHQEAAEDDGVVFEQSEDGLKQWTARTKQTKIEIPAKDSDVFAGNADATEAQDIPPTIADETPAEPKEDLLTPEEEALLDAYTSLEEAQEEQQGPRVAEHGDVGTINQNKSSGSKLQDETGLLAQRLVAAQTQMEVVDVIGKAMKALVGARSALSGNDDNAKAARLMIKKLLKIVQRGQRKVGDLNHEDLLRLQELRERRRQNDARAEEIKAELRRDIQARRRRERKYLEEEEKSGAGPKVAGSTQAKLGPAAEAQITMQAEAQANMEAAASVSVSGGSAGVSFSGASLPASSAGSQPPSVAAGDAPAGDTAAGTEVNISI
jgi:hypothetical protein